MLGVLGGHIEMGATGGWENNVAAGQTRLLAVMGPDKIPGMADIPTFDELDVPLSVPTFLGIGGPAGLPENVVRKWESAVEQVMKSPEFEAYLKTTKQTPSYLNSKDFTEASVK